MKYGKLNLGQVEAIVNKLGGMEGVQLFLSGMSEVVVKKHPIDCDADPYLPEGLEEVVSHKKGGVLEWNPVKAYLLLSPNQQNDFTIRGYNLRKELENEPVLNANVLDYLLAHPELIPEEWKGKIVFFWGTIYRDLDDNLYVRYLYWGGDCWGCDYYWLEDDWDGSSPAVCSQVSSN